MAELKFLPDFGLACTESFIKPSNYQQIFKKFIRNLALSGLPLTRIHE